MSSPFSQEGRWPLFSQRESGVIERDLPNPGLDPGVGREARGQRREDAPGSRIEQRGLHAVGERAQGVKDLLMPAR